MTVTSIVRARDLSAGDHFDHPKHGRIYVRGAANLPDGRRAFQLETADGTRVPLTVDQAHRFRRQEG